MTNPIIAATLGLEATIVSVFAMSADQLNGTALLVSAVGTAITAAGIAVVGVMAKLQSSKLEAQKKTLEDQTKTLEDQTKTLAQVEKQGNSVSLELKRVNMVYARRLANETRKKVDLAVAAESQKVYEEAAHQAELAKPSVTVNLVAEPK